MLSRADIQEIEEYVGRIEGAAVALAQHATSMRVGLTVEAKLAAMERDRDHADENANGAQSQAHEFAVRAEVAEAKLARVWSSDTCETCGSENQLRTCMVCVEQSIRRSHDTWRKRTEAAETKLVEVEEERDFFDAERCKVAIAHDELAVALEIAREALEFYEEERRWGAPGYVMDNDRGERARTALAKLPPRKVK